MPRKSLARSAAIGVNLWAGGSNLLGTLSDIKEGPEKIPLSSRNIGRQVTVGGDRGSLAQDPQA